MSAKPRPFRAGFVQFDIRRGQVGANLKTVLAGLAALAKAKVRLAVLPEMWTSSFIAADVERLTEESHAALLEVRRAARKYGMVVAGSSYERVGRGVHNTAYVVDADGEIVGGYRKIHLFSPGDEHINFVEGKEPLLVQTAVGMVGVTICYDLRFPELYRALAAAGAQVIVVPAQWPVERLAHWQTLLRARAIENQIFVIGANRTGVDVKSPQLRLRFPGASAVVDPWGETLATGRRAGAYWAEIDPAQIAAVRKRIPVWTDRRPQAYKLKPIA